jgi:hypothetical protein
MKFFKVDQTKNKIGVSYENNGHVRVIKFTNFKRKTWGIYIWL